MRGIAKNTKRRAIYDYHRKNADILVLMESHSTPDIEKIWENEWGGRAIFSHGSSNSRGITILTSKEMFSTISNIYKDTMGRLICFDVIVDGNKITICTLYAPNEDNPEFFKSIREILVERSEHKIIVGDFNLVLDVDKDRHNTYNNNNKAKEEVENLMDEFLMKDTWRERNPDSREYSWTKRQGPNMRKCSRIDFALISGGLDQYVEMITYLSSIMTDHRAIYMVVDFNTEERGPGFWKFNTSLLTDLDFIQLMTTEIDNTVLALSHKNPSELWEILKKRIKKQTINFSRKKGSQDALVIAQLSEKVNEYEATMPLTKEDDDLYMETKGELEDKLFEKVKGVMFRSKVRWYEQGEKNTKYFYALEKARYNSKTCFKIINENQEEITNPHSILEAQKDFYEELYKEDKDVNFTWKNSTNIKVPKEIYEQQNLQISMKDLGEAMKTMNNNKTPGGDGIPVDFYKVFWRLLKKTFF